MSFKKYLTTQNVVFALLAIIVLLFISQIQVIALLFFASYVIACSLNPIVDIISKKISRPNAASLVLLGTLIISFALFIPVIFIAIKQVHGLITVLPDNLDYLQNVILTHKFYGHRIPELINIESLIKTTSPFATGLVNQSINITIGVSQGILFFLAICMIVFYFMADKDTIKEGIIGAFPPAIKEKASTIYDNISHKVGGYVIAQILNMLVIAALTGIGLALVRVDYAFILGLIAGVLDIIPVVGPTIALALCLITAYSMGPIALILVLVVFLTAQWIANNLVRPVIFGRFLNLHPLIIIFALLVAAQFLGIWGVILAPAIASLVFILYDEIYIKTINTSDE